MNTNIQPNSKRDKKKQWFLFWVVIESCIFIFTEHIINLLEYIIKLLDEHLIPGLELDTHFYVKVVQLLGFFVICKLLYEINELLAEPVSTIANTLNVYMKQAAMIQAALEQLNAKSPIGLVKEIKEPAIWEFTGNIFGWNPNWSIELSTSNYSTKKLKQIHKDRILSARVSKIEYIFFENYKIDTNNRECFGVDYFLDFLKKIHDEHNKNIRKAVIKGVSKYKIWVIPESIYTDNTLDCYEHLNRYKDFIFLYENKESIKNNNMLIFINKKGFVVNDCHNYYIEIYQDNQIYTDFSGHFEHTAQILHRHEISENKVVFDSTNAKFILQ